ncbi:hypothetical protein HAX54_046408 [Datura stramonium]|uniref:Uncharacterized protein n=1 Tax=Datura stramonium TaxID=4076 RepID=A0ABS8ST51_DATST|nr:hypothetical protein [Datura stramonium]
MSKLLSCGCGDECTLPQYLYTCSSLLTLDLRCCGFDYHADISWKSLKSIKMGAFGVVDEQIEKLIDLYDLKFRLEDVSSVVNAKLTFNIACIKDIKSYT